MLIEVDYSSSRIYNTPLAMPYLPIDVDYLSQRVDYFTLKVDYTSFEVNYLSSEVDSFAFEVNYTPFRWKDLLIEVPYIIIVALETQIQIKLIGICLLNTLGWAVAMGYGIHWSLIDENLSVDSLLKVAARD